MSEAEKFLRDKSLSFYAENPKYYKGLVLKFEDVIKVMEQYRQKQVTLGLPSVIDRLKSIKRYTESYGEGDWNDDGEYVWYEDLEQVIKDFE